MDQDSAFMPSLMTYLLDRFNIKIKTVAPYNHQSVQAEHGIKLLSNIPVQTSYQFQVRCGQSICHWQHLHITCLTPQT